MGSEISYIKKGENKIFELKHEIIIKNRSEEVQDIHERSKWRLGLQSQLAWLRAINIGKQICRERACAVLSMGKVP